MISNILKLHLGKKNNLDSRRNCNAEERRYSSILSVTNERER